MGGFFLVCVGPDENRADEIEQLQSAFAELGFASPEMIKEEEYVLAAYPKFQNKSANLKRYANGDFAFDRRTPESGGFKHCA